MILLNAMSCTLLYRIEMLLNILFSLSDEYETWSLTTSMDQSPLCKANRVPATEETLSIS